MRLPASRRSIRTKRCGRPHAPPTRKRFYKEVATARSAGRAFASLLDGKPIRTPSRAIVAAADRAGSPRRSPPNGEAQGESLDPMTMPMTRLANSVVEGVIGARGRRRRRFGEIFRDRFDLLSRGASGRAGRARGRRHGTACCIGRRTRSARTSFWRKASSMRRNRRLRSPPRAPRCRGQAWPLAACHVVTTLTGSALLALALWHGACNPDEVWSAAHVDEDWNVEQWGVDEEVVAAPRGAPARFRCGCAGDCRIALVRRMFDRRIVLTGLATSALMSRRAFAAVSPPRSEVREALAKRFADAGTEGTFAAYDVDNYRVIVSDTMRSGEGKLPASTFKVANSLIALETGVVGDPDNDVFKWDGVTRADRRRGIAIIRCARAIAASAVPVYQEIARRIGPERMQNYRRPARIRQSQHRRRHRPVLADRRPADRSRFSRSTFSTGCAAACCRFPNAARAWSATSCRSRSRRCRHPRRNGSARRRDRQAVARLAGRLGREGRRARPCSR